MTGQDLYSYERAGLFVRRAALAPGEAAVFALQASGCECAPDIDQLICAVLDAAGVVGTVSAVLGTDYTQLQKRLLADSGPNDMRLFPDLQFPGGSAEAVVCWNLGRHRLLDNVLVTVALIADDRMLVVPGSHLDGAPQSDATNTDEIRVRLASGDVAFHNACLRWRETVTEARERQSVRAAFVSASVAERLAAR